MRVPSSLRPTLVALHRRWRAFRESRRRSVGNVALSNTREAFDEIYGTPGLREEYLEEARLAFYGEVGEICAELGPRRIIDVGCGTGHLLAAIVGRIPPPQRIVGVDFSTAAIERLRLLLPEAEGFVGDIFELPFPESCFDTVVCTEVLEHLDDPGGALAVLRYLCEPGGHILITVPDGERDSYAGHVNFWSFDEFAGFVSDVGSSTVRRTRGGDLVAIVSCA